MKYSALLWNICTFFCFDKTLFHLVGHKSGLDNVSKSTYRLPNNPQRLKPVKVDISKAEHEAASSFNTYFIFCTFERWTYQQGTQSTEPLIPGR